MYEIRVSYVPQRMALVARRTATAETARQVVSAAFAEIVGYIESGGACGAEERIAMFPLDFSDSGEHEIRIAVVIADGVPGPGIELDELPACQVVKTVHRGPHAGLYDDWTAIEEWMDDRDLEPARDRWEVYLNSSDEVSDSELETELLVPLP